MNAELKAKLEELGINTQGESSYAVETLNIVSERDRQDVSH